LSELLRHAQDFVGPALTRSFSFVTFVPQLTGGDPDRSGDEPGKVAGIHTHPTATTQTIDFNIKAGPFISGRVFTLYGGTPSSADYCKAKGNSHPI